MFTTGLGFTLKETSTVSPMQPLALGVIFIVAFKSDSVLFTGVKTGISATPDLLERPIDAPPEIS